jgi:hypothetical protein
MEANCSGVFIIIKMLHFSEMFFKLEVLHFTWMLSGVALCAYLLNTIIYS